MTEIQVIINGENRDVPGNRSIREMLRFLDIQTKAIAVEINGALIENSKHVDTPVNPGDRIEIVTLVGGG